MKRKHLFVAIAALLFASGLWLARESRRAQANQKSSMGVGFKEPDGQPKPGQIHNPNPGQMLRPPNPTRRFTDFTPEQRVKLARQGHGPGG